MTTSPDQPLISLSHVSKRFDTGSGVVVEALRDISFDIYPGEFVAITGRSGSGKSTLLNLLGLLDIPTSGSLHIASHDLSSLSEHNQTRYRLQYVSYVFQSFNLLDQFTTVENISLQLELQGQSHAQATKQGIEILKYLNLDHRADLFPKSLSGGEQQRIAIGRAIARNSRIILADEPTAHLDTSNAKNVITLLRDVSARLQKTIILVTHEPDQATVADRIITLQDGVVISDVRNSPETAVS